MTATSLGGVYNTVFLLSTGGSFNDDKGKKRVLMCPKFPAPQHIQLLRLSCCSKRIKVGALSD